MFLYQIFKEIFYKNVVDKTCLKKYINRMFFFFQILKSKFVFQLEMDDDMMGMDDDFLDDDKPRRGRGRPPKKIKEEEGVESTSTTRECQACGKVSF